MWHVGIDVGGTFTDQFAIDNRSGKSRTTKVLTVKHDRAEGVFNALKAADIPAATIDTLVHGSTTATNALVERSYPPADWVPMVARLHRLTRLGCASWRAGSKAWRSLR